MQGRALEPRSSTEYIHLLHFILSQTYPLQSPQENGGRTTLGPISVFLNQTVSTYAQVQESCAFGRQFSQNTGFGSKSNNNKRCGITLYFRYVLYYSSLCGFYMLAVVNFFSFCDFSRSHFESLSCLAPEFGYSPRIKGLLLSFLSLTSVKIHPTIGKN